MTGFIVGIDDPKSCSNCGLSGHGEPLLKCSVCSQRICRFCVWAHYAARTVEHETILCSQACRDVRQTEHRMLGWPTEDEGE